MAISTISEVDWGNIGSFCEVNVADIDSIREPDAPAGASYLLDTYTGAGAAYSLRKLSSSATNAIRIERASDNAQTDIGFDGDDLDEATIGTFCSGTTCYVVTLYDQSGNGFDAAASSGDYQIYADGSVINLNGLPAIEQVFTSSFLMDDAGADVSDFVGSSQAYIYMVGQPGMRFSIDDFSVTPFYFEGLSGSSSLNFSSVSLTVSTDAVSSAQHIVEGLYVDSSTDPVLYLDNSLMGSIFSSNGAYSPTGSMEAFIRGEFLQEIVVWPINQSSNRADIYTDVSTY